MQKVQKLRAETPVARSAYARAKTPGVLQPEPLEDAPPRWPRAGTLEARRCRWHYGDPDFMPRWRRCGVHLKKTWTKATRKPELGADAGVTARIVQVV